MTNRFRSLLSTLTVLTAATLMLVGCATNSRTPLPDEPAATTSKKPLPTYAESVAKYNQRVLPLDRLISQATMRLTYTDKDGEKHTEEPTGTLQIVRPYKLAIDLGGGSKKFFWFGSDDTRYWWLDLRDADDRIAYVGSHSKFDDNGGAAGKRIGLPLRPLDLIAATGVSPIDPNAKGMTQWSRDGARLAIISPLGAAGDKGLQRTWVDPATMIPTSIELFDARRRYILEAIHTGEERVEITRAGVPGGVGARPRIPSQITIHHFDSGTDIRITLWGATDARISEKAFNLDELKDRLGIERTVDLDDPPTTSH